MSLPIAVQLYSVREEIKKDFVGTLEKVAEIGYAGVEFAGFGELSAEELKSHLDRLGLKAVGSHTAIEMLRDSLDEVIEYNKVIENPYIVVPYADYDGRDDFVSMAEELKGIAEKVKENGMKLCYHNHAHELESYDGEYGLDILYNNVSADLVAAELDMFWVKKAGLDPLEYMTKYSGRLPLVHLKDMKEDGDFAEVGEGIIDMEAIIKKAETMGTEWLIVEQDKSNGSPFDSIELSYNNLKEMV